MKDYLHSRKDTLRSQIENENKDINRLEKLLNFNKRNKKNAIPKSLCDMGLDYLLEVIDTNKKTKGKIDESDDDISEVSPQKVIQKKKEKAVECSPKPNKKKKVTFSDECETEEPTKSKKQLKYAKKRKRKRLVQREKKLKSLQITPNENENITDDDNIDDCQSPKVKKRKLIEVEDTRGIYGDQMTENEMSLDVTDEFSESDGTSVRRKIRRQLNRLSENEMAKVLTEVYSIFLSHPRAIVREIISEEIFISLQNSMGSGWLELELAAFLTALDCNLQQSQSHLAAHVIETIVTKCPSFNEPISIYLTFLYLFGVISSDLVVEMLNELADSQELKNLKSIKSVLKVACYSLKKDCLQSMTQLINTLQSQYDSIDEDMVDLEIEYEDILSIFSQKRPVDSLTNRCDHMKKQMKIWVKGKSTTASRLPLHLKELRDAKSTGHRWWVVGSAYRPVDKSTVTETQSCEDLHPVTSVSKQNVPDEGDEKINRMADRLGLKTESRRAMFRALVSADSPEEAVYLLTRLTQLSSHDSGPGASSKLTTSRIKEQEIVRILFRALVAEKSYNSYYARVLAGLCKSHRKFKMMIKCSLWDLMSKSGQSNDKKMKYGKVAAFLVVNFHCPINLLIKYDFSDKSSENVAFLFSFLQDLVELSVNKVEDITALMKSLHAKSPNQTKKLFRLVSDLDSQSTDRESHSSILVTKNLQLITKILQNCIDF